jgi:uncharacterized circularly permuted ATP-grasp superfamily protein/uncharacterized alpha-E superfamily protein
MNAIAPGPDFQAPSFRQTYSPFPGVPDEMVGKTGDVRPVWQPLLNSLERLGPTELSQRWEDARQLIRKNGVTYNVYADPDNIERPLALDPIPLLISAAEFETLQQALIQRARLLEMVLADLYGPQHLLRHGLLPPDLILAHPGFLRSCHGVHPPGGRHLHLHAVNLGRSPDGRFWALGDRTGAPSGAGYALENRIVLARMLPEVFRDCQAQRLASFFLAWRETLQAIAPRHRDNPSIVLLTPGPYNETYFEHAYLSQYFGFTLAEGGDLTVRGDRVYRKLLGGLQPVDVILRRVDDDYCDPLELRRDSFLGVPGLAHAVRAGNVAIANPLGSGLIETPALLGFLPALCRHLLGEHLLLPSVPSWWCGESMARDHVLANLSRMVIKPAFPAPFEPIFGEHLDPVRLQELADRIRARPQDYVGQDHFGLSTTPVLVDGRLQPRRFVLRTFLAAAGGSFVVMPGGLTRVAATPDAMIVSMQQGGGSKDTFVLAQGPISHLTLLPSPTRPIQLRRGGGDLPSRTADNLFWLGRYAERAEGCVRLLRTILLRLTEKVGLVDVPELPALLRALTHQGMTYPGFVGPGAAARLAAPGEELLSVIFDGSRPGSLQSTLHQLQRVAWMIRDRISPDTWRTLGRITLRGADPRLPSSPAGYGGNGHPAEYADAVYQRSRIEAPGTMSTVLEVLEGLVIDLTAFWGLAMESMTRGPGWQFLDMGRRLERAAHTIDLIRSTLAPDSRDPEPRSLPGPKMLTAAGPEEPLLEALLEVADSTMTYRSRYLSHVQAAPVLDLLLADESNPRSLAFQLDVLAGHVGNLPHDSSTPRRPPEERVMLAALTDLRLADIEVLALSEAPGRRPALDALLGRLAQQLPNLSDKITQSYLTHIQATRQLSSLNG